MIRLLYIPLLLLMLLFRWLLPNQYERKSIAKVKRERTSKIGHRTRRVLLAGCCLTLSFAVGAGAAYNARARNEGNTINAGIGPSLSSIELTGTPPSVVYSAADEVGSNWSVSGSIPANTTNRNLVFNWQWQRCSGDGVGCSNIPGAGGSNTTGAVASYQTTSSDYGQYIRLHIDSNNGFSYSSNLDSSLMVGKTPVGSGDIIPFNYTGAFDANKTYNDFVQGDTLGYLNYTGWDAYPAITSNDLTYQWQSCINSSPASCSDLIDVDGNSEQGISHTINQYTFPQDLTGRYIRLKLTATNTFNDTHSSDLYGTVSGPIKDWVAASAGTGVTLSGTTATPSGTLTADTSAVLGMPPPKITHQWQKCSSTDTTSCVDISGATNESYALTDYLGAGYYYRDKVTIKNKFNVFGAVTAYTPLSDRTTGPPKLLSTPVTLNVADNQDVSSAMIQSGDGIYYSAPIAYGYPTAPLVSQWYRCTNNTSTSSCSPISAATNFYYSLTASDVGYYIRAYMSLSNAHGGDSAWTPASTMVYAPPSNTVAPTISGTASNGSLLSLSSNGTWSGTPTPGSYTYRWQRCVGSTCTNISGATSSSYTLQDGDMGTTATTVRLAVTASNAAGSSTAYSAKTSAITGAPKLIDSTQGAFLSGGLNPNGSITNIRSVDTASNPIWYSNPQPVLADFGTYGMARCPASSSVASSVLYQTTVPSDCIQVTSSTAGNSTGYSSLQYSLSTSDVGWYMSGRSRVTTTAGTTTVWTRATASPVYPNVGGTAAVGSAVSISASPSWGATYTYQWQSCTSSLAANSSTSCTNISGATGTSYTIAAAYQGKYLRIKVSVTYSGTSSSATSATTAAVT